MTAVVVAALVLALPGADARFDEVVRPILSRHGCDAGPCHGTFKGGGFYLRAGLGGHPEDYRSVLERIDRENPRDSVLVQKALGAVDHNGGQNLAPGECDTERLLAWIGGAPDPACRVAPRVRDPARFGHAVAPALATLGCTRGCHATDLTSAARFDALAANPTVPWTTAVIRAALALDRVHARAVDTDSCAYRQLYAYVAAAPELGCESAPSSADFGAVVMPALVRRGCTDSGCHGGGAGGMSLFQPLDTASTRHDYLMLTARAERLLRKLRNTVPHGGGKRLGGPGDCVDAVVADWLAGKPVAACPAPADPPFTRFAAEIQPVLERMTCTRVECHGAGHNDFQLVTKPDAGGLQANYRETVRKIDRDFTALSGVMLRMREPCAYSVVAAWIEGKPKPDCPLRDPDPSIFPKLGQR